MLIHIHRLLLHGPSGCGKSLIVNTISKAYNIPLIMLKCSDIFSKYVGESEENIRKFFKLAKRTQPCCIFLDEIDALVGVRDMDDGDNTGMYVCFVLFYILLSFCCMDLCPIQT